ncbi:fibrinogen-like YCDxxxxGGGW domain-containing protein [Ornithinicoccus hortensis]|uniref:fibrinogen-like YCDxxxxGGGW domain-containing protein n=1 Tax=Ornithinicoccus hortensis TaxID=82346 RepID=UPI00115327E8|nr:fibrinogen-like YCDxxxxGGGW domain-containing protein [Ornithinicoccus hortensis]
MALRQALGLVVAFMVAVAGIQPMPAAQAAPTPAPERDGASPATAAASCWEVKQEDPSAPSGAYWLMTPALQAPQQFYCDQEWDGGGWVLVGKGREGWQEFYEGQGSASELLERELTPSYFSTVQLPAQTVDELVNNTKISDLEDGVRVLRAANAQGTSWQNVQFRYTAKRDRWVWSRSASHPLASYRFDGGSWFNGGTTASFGRDSGMQRVTSEFASGQSWTSGFSYGSNVQTGSNTSQTFLWSALSNGSAPRPYAEVYVRPKLLTDDLGYEAIGDTGTQADEVRAVASSFAARQYWGVTSHFNGRVAEGNAEVQDFAQGDGVVYAAGNFEYVQRGANATGNDKVLQPALAAFDESSGDFVRAFTPTFNNQVKAVEVLPNGNVLAAGDFTVVNGQPALGTVLLDPATGNTVSSWNLEIQNNLSTGVLSVRSLSVAGDYVYLGGSFTHLNNGGTQVYARHAARVNWRTGAPDGNWNPEFDGTLVAVDAAPSDSRMYAAGYFTTSQGDYANKAAAVQMSAGAPLATPQWTTVWSNSDRSGYQQAIHAVGDRVFVGGSEHSLFSYSTDTFERLSGSITLGIGGDFQAIDTDGEVVYGGCHCSSWSYQDAYKWPSPDSSWTQIDKIQWVGAWDANTGDFIPEFNPPFLQSNNAGSWALFVADDGTLWNGGDFTGVRYGPTQSQWAGGFTRFPMRDHEAPSTVTNVSATSMDDASVSLAWSGSSDASGSVRYEILRDDRVVGLSNTPSATVSRGGDDRFFVRAVDDAGNRSASSAVYALDDIPAVPEELVSAGSEWSVWYESAAPGEGWAGAEFDDSGWESGAAPLGWGSAGIVTNIDPGVPSERARAAYFRSEFELEDALSVHALELSAVADDGAVVYVNGTEVGRLRLDPGPVGHDTYANQAISTSAALNDRLVVEVPLGLLQDGTNTIAVETHLNYRSTPNLSFDLSAVAELGDPRDPVDPPADPEEPEDPADPEEPGELVSAGSEWSVWYESAAPGEGWAGAEFDDSGWESGAAPLGWGSAGIVTNIDPGVPSERARAAYFRSEFELEDALSVHALELSAVADDGAVVYVNGTEVGRLRLDPGPVGHDTYANQAISTSAALNDRLVVEVPLGLLQDGTNTIAVETHLNYRSTPNLSFDLSAVAELGDPRDPVDPPADPEEPEDPADPEEPEDPADPEEPGELVSAGSEWSVWYESAAPGEGWAGAEFDDSGWESGAAPLGWGSAGIVTNIDPGVPSERARAAYFRSEFELEDALSVHALELSAVADDGAVVYVNGTEVGRLRLDPGPVGHDTYANQAISTSAALNDRLVVEVPLGLLQDGTNTIAVETHLNYRSTPNLSFDLTLTEAREV